VDIGDAFESGLQWLTTHFAPFFDAVSAVVRAVVDVLEAVLQAPPAWAMIAGFTVLAWRTAGRGVAAFTAGGMSLIAYGMDLWPATMETLALVLASTVLALAVGLPLGIAGAKRDWADRLLRPVLDFMQTMPAFVYLIPAVLLFRLGAVPGVLATVVFAMPPVVRLTNLGIRQVPREVVEAAQAFGSTAWQQLWKVELPVARPTILAGVNQTIMLALSMVVIAALIGAGGLGQQVLKGVTQLQIGLGFESGLAVVILAIVLDRITQGAGARAGDAPAPKTA
jgi:glycine betaine/proline transport system permease protein